MPRKTILIVDDESIYRQQVRAHLEAVGFTVLEAHDGQDALELLDALSVDLMLLDLEMPRLDGLNVLEILHQRPVSVDTIIMTTRDAITSALRAGSLGMSHYLIKPLDKEELLLKVREVLSLREIDQIRTRLAENLDHQFDFGFLQGHSRLMLALKKSLALVAPSEACLLITGEPGTGKELVAKTIVRNSSRKDRPFLTVHCPALPDTLLESELFGHEKGAFSGATHRKPGCFEQAHSGTVFLDEIGDLPLSAQTRLLRFLETHSFERLGGTKPIKSDVRVLTSTNLNLEQEIESGRFREGLYAYLSQVQIRVPNLRDRGPGDIRILAEHFLETAAKRYGRDHTTFSPRALKALQAGPWPGNVRELLNAVERSIILAGGPVVEVEDLPLSVRHWAPGRDRLETGQSSIRPGMTIKEMEAELISRTLTDTGGNRSKAAAKLGITRQTLLNKIKEYGLNF